MESSVLAVRCQRRVECDYIRLTRYRIQVCERLRAFFPCPGWIAQKHTHVKRPGPTLHDFSYMPHAHYAYRMLLYRTVHQRCHRCQHILCHGWGVAPRCVPHLYALCAAIFHVYVVCAYGGGHHHPYA